jgi:hypothetical protein
MLTVGTAFDATTSDGLATNVGPMQEPKVFNNARRAPLPESPGCCELNARMTRMTPMAETARSCCSLSVAAPEIETPERALPSRPTDIVRSSQTPR